MNFFRSIQSRLIGKALAQCPDPFEEGKVIVMFNFSIVMMILTVPYIVASFDQFIGHLISGIAQIILLLLVIFWLIKGYRISLAKNAFLAMFIVMHLFHFIVSNGAIFIQGILFMILLALFAFFLFGRKVGWITFITLIILVVAGIYNTSSNYALFYMPIEFADQEASSGKGQLIILLPMLMIVYLVSEFVAAQKKAQVRINRQNKDLSEKNKEINDSINYAKRIQSAILPPVKLIKQHLPNSFILYKPKDIVAGDFYWLETINDTVYFAAADCTGHGVPGAMVSVICNGSLNRTVNEFNISEPNLILDKTRDLVIQEFEKSEEVVKDGMDIALVSLTLNKKNDSGNEDNSLSHSHPHSVLKYAGAHNPLWIIRKGSNTVEEINADKQPIGKYTAPKPYSLHSTELKPGDTIYIFSDGYVDQFGGEKGKKFKAKNFKALLVSIQHESMERQRELIDQTFENWKGDLEQLDDVCVIGVRI
ncbi:SpoIIE family protein phosphatase [Paracrocinitomix mangrovi]|uniref:PP2C family protein-serine/threonine phosphatase n=1 Tax=Paracrocinitomix mangrovi TaxID=2862509 RepID=UPI001C8ECFFE|nr:SpoIIE family protein phosphatase [Paracrocinitomix mangrovi]UKN00229.1 SpoIIE family protein phosphatase [Paracrocinitomix mangrovi]